MTATITVQYAWNDRQTQYHCGDEHECNNEREHERYNEHEHMNVMMLLIKTDAAGHATMDDLRLTQITVHRWSSGSNSRTKLVTAEARCGRSLVKVKVGNDNGHRYNCDRNNGSDSNAIEMMIGNGAGGRYTTAVMKGNEVTTQRCGSNDTDATT